MKGGRDEGTEGTVTFSDAARGALWREMDEGTKRTGEYHFLC